MKILNSKTMIAVAMTAVMTAFGTTDASAQGFLKKVKGAAEKAAKQVVKQNTGTTTTTSGNPVSAAASKATAKYPLTNVVPTSAKAKVAASDFKPGKTVIFADDFSADAVGSAPAKWVVLDENAGQESEFKVIECDGMKVLKVGLGDKAFVPKMADYNYLPQSFTVEMDVWIAQHPTEAIDGEYFTLNLARKPSNNRMQSYSDPQVLTVYPAYGRTDGIGHWNWRGVRTDEGGTSSICKYDAVSPVLTPNAWTHISWSYNKGITKVYVNGKQIHNKSKDTLKQPQYLGITSRVALHANPIYIANVKICK